MNPIPLSYIAASVSVKIWREKNEIIRREVVQLTLQIHLFSLCEHLIAPAASRTAGVVVLISCLENTVHKADLTSQENEDQCSLQ